MCQILLLYDAKKPPVRLGRVERGASLVRESVAVVTTLASTASSAVPASSSAVARACYASFGYVPAYVSLVPF